MTMNFRDAVKSAKAKAKPRVSTVYSCDINRNEAKICMQLESVDTHGAVRPPHAWFFVIDVSASMGETGKDGMTRLDRVKLFAGFAKRVISDDDFLSIISFSSSAETKMKLTKMNSHDESIAVDCLQELKLCDMTNIDAGLVHALQEMKKAKSIGLIDKRTTLSIIIFTDGGANCGITNGQEMVKKYREMESSIGENVHVPISAFTVGNYRPDFLMEMSSSLGSEAFYWLDESKDFEADMMLPIILRHKTVVNNVQVVMEAMNSAFVCDKTDEHIVNQSSRRLEYFVHMLPKGTRKVFQVTLYLPFSLQRQCCNILDVVTTYCNENGETKKLQEPLRTTGKSILETCASVLPDATQIGSNRLEALKQSSAFIYHDGRYQTSWEDVKKAILDNSTSDILQLALKRDDQHDMTGKADQDDARFYDYSVRFVQSRVALIIQNQFDEDYVQWKEEIKRVIGALQENPKNENPGRLFSMKSALARDMPAPTGVFNDNLRHDGKTWIKDITDLVQEAKESAKKEHSGDLCFDGVIGFLDGDSFMTRVAALKKKYEDELKNTKKNLRPVKEKSFESNLFLGRGFFLSDRLQRRRSIARKIRKHHGEIEQDLLNLKRMTLFVVMETDGATTDSVLFSEASRSKITIVEKNFVDDCINEEGIMHPGKYRIKPPQKKSETK